MNPENYDDVVECVIDSIRLWYFTHQNSEYEQAVDIILCLALGRVINAEEASRYLSIFKKKGETE